MNIVCGIWITPSLRLIEPEGKAVSKEKKALDGSGSEGEAWKSETEGDKNVGVKEGKKTSAADAHAVDKGGGNKMGLGHFLEVLRSPGVASLFTIKIVTGA